MGQRRKRFAEGGPHPIPASCIAFRLVNNIARDVLGLASSPPQPAGQEKEERVSPPVFVSVFFFPTSSFFTAAICSAHRAIGGTGRRPAPPR